MRAIEIFPARLVIGFFRLQFRGARQQQLKWDNDSPSTGTDPYVITTAIVFAICIAYNKSHGENVGTHVEVDCAGIFRYRRL